MRLCTSPLIRFHIFEPHPVEMRVSMEAELTYPEDVLTATSSVYE